MNGVPKSQPKDAREEGLLHSNMRLQYLGGQNRLEESLCMGHHPIQSIGHNRDGSEAKTKDPGHIPFSIFFRQPIGSSQKEWCVKVIKTYFTHEKATPSIKSNIKLLTFFPSKKP